MATSLVVNGVSYLYPDTGDQSWGTVASAWAAAVTSGMLQKSGGTFALTADANFGTNFGLVSKYFKTITANPSSTGFVRLASTDVISWRNNANGGDLALGKNSSDQITYNSKAFINTSGSLLASSLVLNGSVSGALTMSASATTSSYALVWPAAQGAASTTPVNDGSGNLSWAAALTSTLASSKIFVGDGSNLAAAVNLSGDATLANTGAITLATVNGNVGQFTKVTVNAKGLVTAATTLVSGDIPNNAANTSGSAGSLSATLIIGQGGTGQTTKAAAFDALSPMTTGGDIVYGGASGTGTRLANGSAGQVLTSAGSTSAPTWTTPAIQTAVFNETQSVNTDGGTFTQGAWQTRVINTTQKSQSWASISSNQITLTVGTYYIRASAPAGRVEKHQIRFQNITDASTAITGTSEFNHPAAGENWQRPSILVGCITIAGTKTFELQHQCQTTSSTTGFGESAGFGDEVYSVVSITKQ